MAIRSTSALKDWSAGKPVGGRKSCPTTTLTSLPLRGLARTTLWTRAGRGLSLSGNPAAWTTAASPNAQPSLKQNRIEMFHSSIDQAPSSRYTQLQTQCYHFHVSQAGYRSEEHTSELQSLRHLVCRLLLEK